MNTIKAAELRQELKVLLCKWEVLTSNPLHSLNDYEQLRSRIIEVCDALDDYSRYEASR